MYLIKIKGNKRIPGFLQIRDQQFTLVAYFRLKNIRAGLAKNGLESKTDEICSVVNSLHYGVVQKID
ncbi:MAG: fructose-6-phosphate aldolase [Bacteroidetes bacterium]|nr:fructose-6-phosphate aldolase [Bacteroidota bacterium]MBU1717620.1 fructose-6-phosphate aldolase [Bacteroidota bacterium]